MGLLDLFKKKEKEEDQQEYKDIVNNPQYMNLNSKGKRKLLRKIRRKQERKEAKLRGKEE